MCILSFLLFINDLPSAAQRSTVDIYVDDITLSLSSDVTNGLTAMSSALQQDLDDVSRWSAANKMVTNAAKTKCLLVTALVEPDICKTYAHAICLLCWTMFQLCYVHYCLCINYVTHQTT